MDILGKLLKPGGVILLATFDRREGTDESKKNGPPFSVNEKEVRRLYENLDWVESVTVIEEVNEFEKYPERKERWVSQGLLSIFEMCFVIRAKH